MRSRLPLEEGFQSALLKTPFLSPETLRAERLQVHSICDQVRGNLTNLGSWSGHFATRIRRICLRVLFHQMRLNQSDAAVAVGFCFIISSMPFFISFAEGSALWVPTIQL